MKDCWIDQKGKIYEVGDCMHNDFAEELLRTEMDRETFHKTCYGQGKYPYEILHERGWVRVKFNTSDAPKVKILGGCIDLTKQQRNTIDPAMNSHQMRVAKLICEEVGEDFYRAINDKRFW